MNTNTKIIITIVFLLFSGSCYAIQLDLQTCINMGIKNNPKIKASIYNTLSKSEQVKSSFLDLVLPEISITRSRQRLKSVDSSGAVETDYLDQTADVTSFNISKDILKCLTDLTYYHRTKLEKKLSEYQQKMATFNLIRDISATFYNILKTEEDIKSLKDAIAHLKVNLEFAKALFKKRLISYTGVLNAEVDLEDVKQKLSVEKNRKIYYLNYLKTLIGIPLDTKITLKEVKPLSYSLERSFEECLKYALKHRPELSILEFRKKIYEDEKKIWLKSILPKLDIGISYNEYSRDYDQLGRGLFGYYDRDFDISYWNTYISMRWELTSVPKSLVQIKRTKFDIKSIEEQIEDAKYSIMNEVRTYYLSVQEAIKRIYTAKVALKAAEENYRQAEEKFRLLIGSISEVLDAQQRLTRAKANYNQAVLDFQISLINLKYSMGMLEGAER